MRRINATLQDVAAAAGVSKTTAASILRGDRGFQAAKDTRERVLGTAARLGYRRNALAAALSSGRTHTVALLLPPLQSGSDTALARTFGQDVFVAVLNAASGAGLRVLPTPLPAPADTPISLKNFVDGRADGLILVSLRDREFVEQAYASAALPCVEMSSGFGKRLIQPDNAGGAAAAVTHLAQLGHRRIAHWRGGGAANSASEQRLAGFLAAAERHGLRPHETPVAHGAEAVAALLTRPAAEQRPTAVFAFNDHQAFMTLDIARGLGLRVPDDLSIVGFDDNILAEVARPRLTTVYNPIQEQANAAIRVLQALWRGETDPPVPENVPTRLVIRQSTAVAPY